MKLTPIQSEVLSFMEQGWELSKHNNGNVTNGTLAKNKETRGVSIATIESLKQKRKIKGFCHSPSETNPSLIIKYKCIGDNN